MVSESVSFPWHDSICSQWLQRIERQKIPHSLLIVGRQGLAKRALAEKLGQMLLCKQPSVGPCGHCDRCHLIAASSHPDWIYCGLTDDASVIKVDQIRQVTEKLQLTAQYQGYKVALIDGAESMNLAASNALLKTLEEPQGKTLLLLVSDRPGALLPTIRSRCQRINVVEPDRSSAVIWLQNQGIQQAEYWLDLSKNSPLKALNLASQDEPLTLMVSQQLDALLSRHIDPLTLADKFSKLPLADVLVAMLDFVDQVIQKGMFSASGCQNSERSRLIKQFNVRDQLHKSYVSQAPGLNARTLLERELIAIAEEFA